MKAGSLKRALAMFMSLVMLGTETLPALAAEPVTSGAETEAETEVPDIEYASIPCGSLGGDVYGYLYEEGDVVSLCVNDEAPDNPAGKTVSVKIGEAEEIGDYKDKITDIYFLGHISTLEDEVFSGMKSLKNVKIGGEITSIGNYVFKGCTALEELTFEKGTGELAIGYGAFSGCTKLNNVTLPARVAETLGADIDGWSIFSGCTGLGTAGLEEGALYVPKYAFKDAESLVSVTIPSSVTRILPQAFSGCKALSSVTLPAKLQEIGEYAFMGCGIESLSVPGNVTSIDRQAFDGNKSLTTLVFEEGTKELVIGLSAFSGCVRLDNVTIPARISETVGADTHPAFGGCSSLTTAVIEDGAPYVPRCVFYGVESLQNVTIPSGVAKIGNYAFSGCSSLEAISLPAGLLQIGDYAFKGTSLQEVAIPGSVTSIGREAFENIKTLKNVRFEKGKGQLDVDVLAFANCVKLNDVTLPARMADSIGNYYYPVFSGCTALVSAGIEEGATMVPGSAFAKVAALQTVKLPASLEKVGASAFAECTGLSKVSYAGTKSKEEIKAASGENNEALWEADWEIAEPEPEPSPVSSYSYTFYNDFGADGLGYSEDLNYHIPVERYTALFGNKGTNIFAVFDDAWGGSCYGLSSTSALFNEKNNGVNASDYQAGAESVSQLNLSKVVDYDASDDTPAELKTDLRKFIEAMQISQCDDRVQYCISLDSDPEEIIRCMEEDGRPLIIGLFGEVDGQPAGHAVLAYDLKKTTAVPGYRLYIYDSNWPGQVRFITIEEREFATADGEPAYKYYNWRYDLMEAGTENSIEWSSNGGAISYVPYDVYSAVWFDGGDYDEEEWAKKLMGSGEWTDLDEFIFTNFYDWDEHAASLPNPDRDLTAEEEAELRAYMNGETDAISTELQWRCKSYCRWRCKGRLNWRCKGRLNWRCKMNCIPIRVKSSDYKLTDSENKELLSVTDGKIASSTENAFAGTGMGFIAGRTYAGRNVETVYAPAGERNLSLTKASASGLDFVAADGELLMEVKTDARKAAFDLEEDKNLYYVRLDLASGQKLDLAFTDVDVNGRERKITISGNGFGKEAVVSVSGNGVDVENLEDPTLSIDGTPATLEDLEELFERKTIKETLVPGIELTDMWQSYDYTGAKIKPDLKVVDYRGGEAYVLAEGVDYSVAYGTNKEGTGTVQIKGKGNYAGKSKLVSFDIIKPAVSENEVADLSGAKIGTISPLTFNGKEQQPATIVLKLKGEKSGTSYSWNEASGRYEKDGVAIPAAVTFSNNMRKGSATIALTGKNGKVIRRNFKIMAADIDSVSADSILPVGWAVKPEEVKVEFRLGDSYVLTAGQDYKIKYSVNEKDGKITLSGKGNFKGTKTLSYAVAPLGIISDHIIVDAVNGKAGKVKVMVVDDAGNAMNKKFYSYKLLREDGTELKAGDMLKDETIRVIVTGTEKSKGMVDFGSGVTATVNVRGTSLAKNIKAAGASVDYLGRPIKAEDLGAALFKGDPVYGVDYRVVGFKNNAKKGTMTVVLSSMGDFYSGTATVKIKIKAKSLN
ncbi:MAG: leucine-rich repeat domain-containing protein [Lachnospiraceae bacterium]|nr:leucine-rich repeat domain-containing protein [Lachnospiraceae bacterium]